LLDRLRIQLRYFAPLNWRSWTGIARTLVLLLSRAKRKLPDSIVSPRQKIELQRP
jgi:hypothetical protein